MRKATMRKAQRRNLLSAGAGKQQVPRRVRSSEWQECWGQLSLSDKSGGLHTDRPPPRCRRASLGLSGS